MSYLSINGSPVADQSKATISLWFRIPKASIDAAAKEFEKAWNSDPTSEFAYGGGWVGGGQQGARSLYSSKPPQMAGIIPLLIFGKTGAQANRIDVPKHYGDYLVTTYFYHDLPPLGLGNGEWLIEEQHSESIDGTVSGSSATWSIEPSYVGVWCTANPPRALLAVNLEMATRAVIQGFVPDLVDHQVDDRSFYDGPLYGSPGGPPARTWSQTSTYGDVNPNPYLTQTECFRTHPLVGDIGQYDGVAAGSPPFGITVTPDQWHHLLLSFDLTTPCRTHGEFYSSPEELAALNNAPNPSPFVDSAPEIWIAFDDVNKQGRDLSYYWPGKGASGGFYDPRQPDKADATGVNPNEVLTPNSLTVAGTAAQPGSTTSTFDPNTGETVEVITTGISQPKYSVGSVPLPMQGEPMGLPAPAQWVDSVHHIELAELQMFAGVAADTADVNVRRAFIDKNGKPVSPTKKATAQDRHSGSIELFGSRPVVMLHFSGNWIKGKNTGSSGVDSKGNTLPSGQFVPVGGIKKYKPDPSLFGKQGP